MRRVCLVILSLIMLFMSGCQGQQPDISLQTQPPQQTEAPTVPPVQTQPPTEPPTEPPTQPPTEPAPEQLLHSGLREDGSFDEGTLFVGDSLTYGLLRVYLTDQNLLGQARYMAMPGAAPTVFFGGPRLQTNSRHYSYFSEEFEGMLMSEAVSAAGESVTAIYFMMGTNHNDRVNVQLYIDIVSYMLEACPNATIYLQRVPNAKSTKVGPKAANERIQEAFGYFAQQEELRVQLIDTQTAIGYSLTKDGIHLTSKGQRLWYEALVAYAVENEIAQ